MRQMLLQNATAILLQNATEVYYKMRQVFYYKMRQFYYKMRLITNCNSFITKWDVYYKLRQYNLTTCFLLLQNSSDPYVADNITYLLTF